MKAPSRAMTPPATHAPRISAGVWTRSATTYGLMKIPEPTMPPITTMVASKRPSCATRAGRAAGGGAPISVSRV